MYSTLCLRYRMWNLATVSSVVIGIIFAQTLKQHFRHMYSCLYSLAQSIHARNVSTID